MIKKKIKAFEHLAQTSDNPMGFEVESAEGIYFYDKSGNKYIDLISGICVNNLGHRHPSIIQAIREQCDKYLHVMAYGEFVEKPQTDYADLLTKYLPSSLNSVYFVNSGSEAVEGALKLAKRFTGRTEIISFQNSYFGGTHGALSIAGNSDIKRAFVPLLPDIKIIKFNDLKELDNISHKTACVVAECIQSEAGYILPDDGYLQALRKRCTDTGAMLVIDEVQTGFGRTGKLFCTQNDSDKHLSAIVPDVLILAKALGGGMPLGAFISSSEIMGNLMTEPVLGHITTFGGHPVCCAAGMAFFKELIKDKVYKSAEKKGKLFRQYLNHKKIIEIRGRGLLLAVRFASESFCQGVINECMKLGLITDSFVFAGDCLRISPPLIINEEQIKVASFIILEAMDNMTKV